MPPGSFGFAGPSPGFVHFVNPVKKNSSKPKGRKSSVALQSEVLIAVALFKHYRRLGFQHYWRLISAEYATRIAPETLDLSKPGCKDKIVSHEDPAKWDIRDTHALWSDMPTAIW